MLVAAMSVKFFIRDSHSLKDTRRVVRSIKERLRNKFNIAVAEIDSLDMHNYAAIGIAAVANESRLLEEILGKIVGFLESDYRIEIVKAERAIY
jgi:uncharacterized protein YlxP (DUF503 family)